MLTYYFKLYIHFSNDPKIYSYSQGSLNSTHHLLLGLGKVHYLINTYGFIMLL